MLGGGPLVHGDQGMISIEPLPGPDEGGDVLEVELVREVAPPGLVVSLGGLELDLDPLGRVAPGAVPACVVRRVPQGPLCKEEWCEYFYCQTTSQLTVRFGVGLCVVTEPLPQQLVAPHIPSDGHRIIPVN